MSTAPFRVTRLDGAHDRSAFDCASEPLNRYLRERVTADIRRRVTVCFVALAESNRIAGYWGLKSNGTKTYAKTIRPVQMAALTA